MRTLQISDTDNHTIVGTQENTAHTGRNGSTAPVAAVPYPCKAGKATWIVQEGQWSTKKEKKKQTNKQWQIIKNITETMTDSKKYDRHWQIVRNMTETLTVKNVTDIDRW